MAVLGKNSKRGTETGLAQKQVIHYNAYCSEAAAAADICTVSAG
jgi:hypothetical protein